MMSNRVSIQLHESFMSINQKMSEGIPGAFRVLFDLSMTGKKYHQMGGIGLILSLDDMNIWGEQIWIGYKDHCGEDLDKFAKCIMNRDADMVLTINNESGSRERATTSGASFKR